MPSPPNGKRIGIGRVSQQLIETLEDMKLTCCNPHLHMLGMKTSRAVA